MSLPDDVFSRLKFKRSLFYSPIVLYVYSFILAAIFANFVNYPFIRIGDDNILTVLSAKLALTPFMWGDARLGFITSYLLHPLAFVNIYDLFRAEMILKPLFIAFVPVALLFQAKKPEWGFVLLPVFYLIAFFCNTFTVNAVLSGIFFYYFASLALFFAAELIASRLKIRECSIELSLFHYGLIFCLCAVAYWINLSLIVFVIPYAAYLIAKGLKEKEFLAINVLAYLPVYFLNRATEIHGINYAAMRGSLTLPFVLLYKFFYESGDWHPANIAIMAIFGVALWWMVAERKKGKIHPEYRPFFIATLIGMTVFWLAASQFKWVQASWIRSERYITIAIVLVAFWAPLAVIDMIVQKPALLRLRSDSKKILMAGAIGANLLFAGLVIGKFQILKLTVPPPIEELIKIAQTEKADVLMGTDEGDQHVRSGGYWAIWQVVFHGLGQGGSLKNALVPVANRCEALLPQIHEILASRPTFRALCVGGDTQKCLKESMRCGFLDYNTSPKLIDETTVSNLVLGFDEQPIKISTLEFTRAGGNAGNLIGLLDLDKRVTLMPSGTLHIPKNSNPYTATYGPHISLLPGDYRLSINCTAQDADIGSQDAIADLSVLFAEKNMTFKKVSFTGPQGLIRQNIVFNVPDFKLFFPMVQFLLTPSGKAALDCNEFRLTPL